MGWRIDKTRAELRAYWASIEWHRLKDPRDWLHFYVDQSRNACRFAGYTKAHVDSILYPVMIVTIIVLWRMV